MKALYASLLLVLLALLMGLEVVASRVPNQVTPPRSATRPF
jgi:hypothetical protein